MRGVVNALDHQPHSQGNNGEYQRRTEQPAELAAVDLSALSPQKYQQRAVQAENRPRRTPGNRLVALNHQRKQIASDARAKVQAGKAQSPEQRLHQPANVPKGPHIEYQMDEAKMQEHRCRQSPPLAVLRRRAEACAPLQLHAVVGVPQPGAIGQGDRKNQQVQHQQRERDG